MLDLTPKDYFVNTTNGSRPRICVKIRIDAYSNLC